MAISIRLPGDVEARLKNLAALTGRSKTYYVTEAICEHLDDLEDLYLAERELEAIRAGTSSTASLAEVMKRHRMEGCASRTGTEIHSPDRPANSAMHSVFPLTNVWFHIGTCQAT